MAPQVGARSSLGGRERERLNRTGGTAQKQKQQSTRWVGGGEATHRAVGVGRQCCTAAVDPPTHATRPPSHP